MYGNGDGDGDGDPDADGDDSAGDVAAYEDAELR